MKTIEIKLIEKLNKTFEKDESIISSLKLFLSISLIGTLVFIGFITLLFGPKQIVLYTYIVPLLGFAIAYYCNHKDLFGIGILTFYITSVFHVLIVVWTYQNNYFELMYLLLAVIPMFAFNKLTAIRITYFIGYTFFILGGFQLKGYNLLEVLTWPKPTLVYFFLMNVVFISFYQFFIKFKKNSLNYKRELLSSKTKIEKQNELIKLNTKMLVKFEKDKHEMHLANKQKDVESLQINNQLKVKMKNDLIKQLQKARRNKEKIDLEVHAIINRLKYQIEEEKKIDLIQANSDVIGADFNDRIKQEFSELTKSEIELLSFLKLKLSNKQIAIQKNTSPNTINVALHRLKSKCSFGSTNELKEFVEGF